MFFLLIYLGIIYFALNNKSFLFFIISDIIAFILIGLMYRETTFGFGTLLFLIITIVLFYIAMIYSMIVYNKNNNRTKLDLIRQIFRYILLVLLLSFPILMNL